MLKLSLIIGLLIIAHSVDASVARGQFAEATVRVALDIKHHMLR